MFTQKIVQVMDEARPDEGADERAESADFAFQLASSFSHFPANSPYFPGKTLIEMVAAHFGPKERCRPSANCIVSL